MMNFYKTGRIENEKLMHLCIANQWFTCGSGRQYDKLFEMNSYGAPIEQIATAIWLCSDDEENPDFNRRDIILKLREAGFTETCDVSEKEHLQDWLGI